MQTWTPEMWQAALVGLISGFLLGYFILRLTKGSVKQQVKTEAELKQVKVELDNQKQRLEKHFAESADLLKTLAKDYQKLYSHLATSSNALLPELATKELFSPLLINEKIDDSAENDTAIKKNPPRDYSEGSSGILKVKK
ncbi:putative transmembrane protein [[Pasteurella] mairii]|uniref:Z-ring associated protein G n=1 Tax=[Pasteurella] mairii TaxID=757 RepID=A0A379B468_9PAST|nr:putative transmembrane protein [[Pasteurella] mairii]